MAQTIDLCKLRPGDIIFTLYPAVSSCGIALSTGSIYSHAIIVLYPDVWFETDGAGSGFKIIDDVRAYNLDNGGCSILSDLPYMKFNVVRLPVAPAPHQILAAIARHIAQQYPKFYEFLPLIVGLNHFPRIAEWFVEKLGSGRADKTGSYCSQLVFKILDETVGLATYRHNGHISPGRLRSNLIRRDKVSVVNVSPPPLPSLKGRDSSLEYKYSRLSLVTNKLASFQYPHNRASFDGALQRTFEETGLPFRSVQFTPDAATLRTIITRPKYFQLHDVFWPSRYY